jgi:UDP-2,4-diacetamido-2,4,6-trideoxy-beta-L-altropyranose hydrolase
VKVVLRADGSARVGTGHVMRCIALVEALKERGGECHFASAELSPALTDRLAQRETAAELLNVRPGSDEDLAQTTAAAHRLEAEWGVLDGYAFDAAFHAGVRRAGLRLLVLDDGGRHRPYDADLVLNANLFADPAWYVERCSDTRLLLGPRYALLGQAFRAWRDWQRPHPSIARRLIVTLGGSDPDNVTASVLGALADIEPPPDVVAVVGGANPHADIVGGLAHRMGADVVRDPPTMGELFAAADLAVASGGTTALELAFMGLPAVLLAIAPNQRPVVTAMSAAGAALAAAADDPRELREVVESLALDERRRSAMSARGRELVDGRGAERVARAMAAASGIQLRPARQLDRRLVWEGANDGETRRASFSPEPIPWEDHVRWFDERLARRPADLFIVENRDGEPVGQVRLEVHGRRGRMPINVAPQYRRHGYGSLIIDVGSSRLLERAELDGIDVNVRPDNQASLRAFEAADFRRTEEIVKDGQLVIRLQRNRDQLPVST